MNPDSLDNADRDALSRLMAVDDDQQSPWASEELGVVLRHQLDAELVFDVTHFGGPAANIPPPAAGESHDATRTFGQLLTHPEPPLNLLDLARRFFKSCRTRDSGRLPDEVATLLYYATIAAARVRLGERISQLNDESLRQGLQWSLGQSWLDEPLRSLLAEAMKTLPQAERKSDG